MRVRRSRRALTAASIALGVIGMAHNASAQATLLNGYGGTADYGVDQVVRADDESSVAIPISTEFPSGVTLNGTNFTSVYVNINGNISFGNPLRDFTPTAFPGAMVPIVSAWWADVDTRLGDASTETDGVYWHIESGLFVATWFEVGYFDQHRDLRNSFQIVMRDAVATGGAPGDVDLEFRYNRCEWTTGDASGGDGGFGGTIAFAGYDFTSVTGGSSTAFSVLPGSGTPAVLNLCTDSNVGQPGVWALQVRAGVVTYCGNGTVDPNEECDPSAAPFPECTPDCHLCTASTCPPPPDVIEPDVPFDDGVIDVPEIDVQMKDAPVDDVPAMDAGLDANPPVVDSGRTVSRYGGGGLLSCAVSGKGMRTGTFTGGVGVCVLMAAAAWMRRRRRASSTG